MHRLMQIIPMATSNDTNLQRGQGKRQTFLQFVLTSYFVSSVLVLLYPRTAKGSDLRKVFAGEIWSGAYFYRDNRTAVNFVLTIDHVDGDSFTGRTSEPKNLASKLYSLTVGCVRYGNDSG
jgi:hypothetical protein